ncbi:hypothetical protein G7B40_037910 [Aetokthonos hydrillicola Thurmond2011]|jgi:hypothetical protein|uniref:Pectate lyase n=1 Tax=Aetokthonos hydrillicola Thurmond2011 TaxID=2712845 RepID=A0AAP5II69_9CYAN|nr:hypothetical protein [Aetokthonos hydrillicola]MBO3464263.1 hypothetical protein [Aetokthonos hydrillicola CCALA 1050]MBW4589790.1 hypothetical protein [Aetokthonos hydrillicola CCALA 1050]MDR9900285.1 hypothetical protein [Aetokthonos hydrillicola Thurmond2011]
MRFSKKLISALFGVSSLAYSMAPAAAVQYNGASVYKATENGVTTVYIDGTANSKVAVDLGQLAKTTSKIATECGSVKISTPKGNPEFTGLTVDGLAINYANLSTQTLPACVNGTFAESRTGNFKTAKGQVIIVGKTPGASVSISVLADSMRSITVNGCGNALLRASKGSTLPATFTINGSSYTLASLPDSGHGPVCKKASDGTYAAYTPSNWPK